MQKIINASMKASLNDRRVTVVASTESEDRDSDIILSSAWRLDNFKRNAVVLYGHDSKSLPVAKAVNTFIDPVKKALILEIQFPDEGVYTFADTVYKLIKAGFLNSVSVGFLILDYEPQGRGRKITAAELLEVSFVPCPAQPEALVMLRSKGFSSLEIEKLKSASSEIDLNEIVIDEEEYIRVEGLKISKSEINEMIRNAVTAAVKRL